MSVRSQITPLGGQHFLLIILAHNPPLSRCTGKLILISVAMIKRIIDTPSASPYTFINSTLFHPWLQTRTTGGFPHEYSSTAGHPAFI